MNSMRYILKKSLKKIEMKGKMIFDFNLHQGYEVKI